MAIYEDIARNLHGLKDKLKQAGILDSPEMYVRKISFTAIMMSLGFVFIIFMFYPNFSIFIIFPFLVPFFFLYFIKFVDVKIIQLQKKIDQEIVFAGRFLIIELNSGVPFDKAFENLEKNYPTVGRFFGDIMNKVYLGTSLEDAINEILRSTSSANLRRLLWQILNSIKTGAEAEKALNLIIDQIVREQQIAVKEYGKKLNPIAMFYMMVSIILPSIGMTMLVVLATFIGWQITMPYFLVIAGLIGFMQFMFLSIIRTQRPPVSV